MPRCKDCFAQFPSQTPEAALQKTYRIRRRNQQFIWDYYKAHHLRDKTATISRLVHHTRSLKVIREELAKCEILCRNCHTRRTAEEQGWYPDIVR